MGRRRKEQSFKTAAEMMDSSARTFHLTGVINRHRLFALWEKIVGPRLYEICRPERLIGDTLTVRVVDSVWGQELKMFTADVLASIAKQTGQDTVKKIRLVTGPIDKQAARPAPLPPLESVAVETGDIERRLADSRLARFPELLALIKRMWANARRIAKRTRGAKTEK